MERLKRKRGGLIVALVAFCLTATMAVVINTLIGYGFHLEYSISRYVGLEFWSAAVFTAGNCLATAMTCRYMWQLGEDWKMPRIYYYCAFLMAVGLIWLSLCPVGYCDTAEAKSLVSYLHEISSRTMFLMMLLVSTMLAGAPKASALARGVSTGFVVYGVFCVTGYFTQEEWFLPLILIFESMYIIGFVIVLMCQTDRKVISRKKITAGRITE